MNIYLYCISFIIFCCGCYKELPDIQRNLAHDEDIPLFEIDSVWILPETQGLSTTNIKVFYTTRYFEFTEDQRDKVILAKIYRDGRRVSYPTRNMNSFDEDHVFFFKDRVDLGTLCYDLSYFAGSGDLYETRVTRQCIEL